MSKLVYNLGAIRHNAKQILSVLHKHQIQMAFVNKVSCGDTMLANAVMPLGASQIADSRTQNLSKYGNRYERLLLRLSDEPESTVMHSEISLESEAETILKLNEAAKARSKIHKVILMIDLGDLREGLFFRNMKAIKDIARRICALSNIAFVGVGANLSCFGGILPSEENLGKLCQIAALLRKECDLPLPIVSGGNSSTLPLVFDGRVPSGISHIRIGESLVLGTNTQDGTDYPFLKQDGCYLSAAIIELQEKPSVPIGESGLNAFGEKVHFEDKGTMLRAILAVGKQDVSPEDLSPLDHNAQILGASSDHLLLDVSRLKGLRLGDSLKFRLSYGGLLRLSTSPYIQKEWEAPNHDGIV